MAILQVGQEPGKRVVHVEEQKQWHSPAGAPSWLPGSGGLWSPSPPIQPLPLICYQSCSFSPQLSRRSNCSGYIRVHLSLLLGWGEFLWRAVSVINSIVTLNLIIRTHTRLDPQASSGLRPREEPTGARGQDDEPSLRTLPNVLTQDFANLETTRTSNKGEEERHHQKDKSEIENSGTCYSPSCERAVLAARVSGWETTDRSGALVSGRLP